MSTFLSLSDDDIELLNRQFGLKLTREEWNRRLTTTPTFASLVRSYFDWHISELAALAAGDDRLPAGINAIDARFPTPPSCDASSISPAAGTTAPTKWMPRAP